jgi:hypothetical protein
MSTIVRIALVVFLGISAIACGGAPFDASTPDTISTVVFDASDAGSDVVTLADVDSGRDTGPDVVTVTEVDSGRDSGTVTERDSGTVTTPEDGGTDSGDTDAETAHDSEIPSNDAGMHLCCTNIALPSGDVLINQTCTTSTYNVTSPVGTVWCGTDNGSSNLMCSENVQGNGNVQGQVVPCP